jgi:large subunit ribosomal protein L6
MSRVGKKPVKIPSDIEVTKRGNEITVKGPKGTTTQWVDPVIKVIIDDGEVRFERNNDSKNARSKHGLYRSLLENMIEGVTNGYRRILMIFGTGYRAELKGNSLSLSVGHSHPVIIEPPEGIVFEVEDRKKIVVSGIDKQLVNQIAAIIRDVHPPEPYVRKPEPKKGIFYENEQVKLKIGKSGA